MKDKFDIDFDVRVVDRNIRDSKITRKEYDEKLEVLEDLSELAEPLVIEDDTEQEQDEDTETSEDTELQLEENVEEQE